MVATTLPNLARLAERSSPPEKVAQRAGQTDFLTAFRQAASDRGAQPSSLPNLACLAEHSRPAAATEDVGGLEIVSDANFESAVLGSPQPVLLEFYGEYCGPCRQCEPALVQLGEAFAEIKVVKARLNSNPAMEEWLLGKGLKVSKLPTLLLVHGGAPLRALTGKVKILDLPTLHGFAFDATFEGAVVPTKGAVKHAHDGARADVAPGAAPDDYEAELEAMGEREQTRELQELVSRLRASQSAAPGELATLEAMLRSRRQHEQEHAAPAPAHAAPEVVCSGGVCQRR